MNSIKDKRHGQTMAVLVISLSIACIFQTIRVEQLQYKVNAQNQAIERYMKALFHQSLKEVK